MIDLLNTILAAMVRENASDVYIRADSHPFFRVEGELVEVEVAKFTQEMLEDLKDDLLRPEDRESFKKKPEANITYANPNLGRFRANIYVQRGTIAIVMRKIRDDILEFSKLGLPPILEKLALIRSGLVLITGPTGSGKSTTLASMVRYRNENSSGHIITIEDPVEFVHSDMNCIVSQREVGIDTMSFQDALESALRQAPDVLLVGEMRDVESVKAGVYFAETGHLVLSTLHSNNTIQTVERMLQFFPTAVHDQILQQLSINLKAVVSQRLIKNKDGTGRLLVCEVMIVNARVSELLIKGELNQIRKELDQFASEGMVSFDVSLIEKFKNGELSAEQCMRASDNPNDMRLKLKTLPVFIRSSGREDERYAQ
ncbi:MAG: PilT/PilU family type 4a pilus ATPase [Candidatus Eremiobacteraeota bacterium]|nr:PilT/PilU family type 4a pilus ATPase [Candidatus Eremiobacteraeota bacterium]